MSNETITLRTTFSDGSGGEAKLYHFANGQLDAEGHPLPSPPALTASSNQNAFVHAFVNGTEVDVRAVGKAPANISQATVTISDGRTVNGQPLTYTITVLIEQNPDLSAVAPTSSDPVRAL